MNEMPHSGIVTIDDPTLPSRQHEVNNIKDYGFSGRTGSTPSERSGKPPPARAVLDHYAWQQHCRGLFQMPIAA